MVRLAALTLSLAAVACSQGERAVPSVPELRYTAMPGNANLVEPDEICGGLDLPRATVETAPGLVLNNSSGFGGSNVCHVLRRPD